MKKTLINLSFFLILIIISVIVYFIYHNQHDIKITNLANNSSDFTKQNNLLSYSYNDSSNFIPNSNIQSSSKNTTFPIKFTFNEPTIDERNPFVKDTMSFESQISDNNFTIQKINLGNILISFNSFTIQIHGATEDLPWNRPISYNDIFINTFFHSSVNRLDYSNNQNEQNYLKIINLNYKYIYSYTNEFNSVCPKEAPKDIYCGNSIILYSKDKNLKGEFGLTCLLNNKSDLYKCDEFIQNLTISKNGVKLF